MPFPFYWMGALIAGLLLAGVLTIFAFALEVVMGATSEVGASVLPGLVAGFREWTADRGGAADRPALAHGSAPAFPIEDIPMHDGSPLERVQPHVR